MTPLSEAIRRCYEDQGLRQADVAERIGIDQPTVSKWSRGKAVPTVDQLQAIERACDRPIGWLFTLAGYCACPDDFETCLGFDLDLEAAGRQAVTAVYRTMVEQARANRLAARRPPAQR